MRVLLALCAAASASCEKAAANRAAPDAQDSRPVPDAQTARADSEPEEYPKDITDTFAREGPLTLNGYEVTKRERKPYSTYALLKRGGRVVAKFDGWDFFERAYARADRDALRKKIAAELDAEPVYRFLRRTTAKR